MKQDQPNNPPICATNKTTLRAISSQVHPQQFSNWAIQLGQPIPNRGHCRTTNKMHKHLPNSHAHTKQNTHPKCTTVLTFTKKQSNNCRTQRTNYSSVFPSVETQKSQIQSHPTDFWRQNCRIASRVRLSKNGTGKLQKQLSDKA